MFTHKRTTCNNKEYMMQYHNIESQLFDTKSLNIQSIEYIIEYFDITRFGISNGK